MSRQTPSKMIEIVSARTHDDNSTSILAALNESQAEIELLRRDWRFCMKTGDNAISITTVAGTKDYDLADDFMWPLAVVDTSNDYKLDPRSIAWWADYDATDSTSGDPTFYILLGPNGEDGMQTIRLTDIPGTSDETIKVPYYCHLPALDDSPSVNLPSRIPYSEILMLGAERRSRIGQEEGEDNPVIARLDMKYYRLLKLLTRHYASNPDSNEGLKMDEHLTHPDIYA